MYKISRIFVSLSRLQQVAHWQRLYLHEKRKTADMEQNCLQVRHDLENLHRRIMSKAQTSGLPVGYAKEAPSKKVRYSCYTRIYSFIFVTLVVASSYFEFFLMLQLNYKISCMRLEHEISDLRKRIENLRLKSDAEVKVKLLILYSFLGNYCQLLHAST